MRRFRFWRRSGVQSQRHSASSAERPTRVPSPDLLSRSQSEDRDQEFRAAVDELRRLFDQLAEFNLARSQASSDDTDDVDTEAEAESDGLEEKRPGEVLEEALKVAVSTPKALAALIHPRDIVTLSKMMKAYPPLLNVQLCAIKILIMIEREIPRLRRKIVEHALVYTLQAMQIHQGSEELQTKVLKLLVNVSVFEEASIALVVHKGVKAMSNAVRSYPNSSYIAKKATLLLHNLSQSHQNHFEILRQDGVQLIFRVLRLAARDEQEGKAVGELAMDTLRELVDFASANEIYKRRDAMGYLMERVAQFEGLSDSASDGAEEDELYEEMNEGSAGFEVKYPETNLRRKTADGKPPLPPPSQRSAKDGLLSSFLRSAGIMPVSSADTRDKNRGLGLGHELGFESEANFAGLPEAKAAVERCANVHSVLGIGKFSAVMLCSNVNPGVLDGARMSSADNLAQSSATKLNSTPFVINETHTLAVKVMFRPWSEMTDGQRAALTREAGLLLSLQQASECEHIVKLLDVVHIDAHCLLMFPHCGPDAHFLIVEGGPFSVAEAQSLARQLLLALDHMAKCGIVHRDIKPENMLIQTQREGGLHLVVADFGFARTLSQEDPLSLPLGTFGYIAPEVLFGDGYGTGADVWAAGVSVLRMLLGYPTTAKHVSRLTEEERKLAETTGDDPWIDLWARCQILMHQRDRCNMMNETSGNVEEDLSLADYEDVNEEEPFSDAQEPEDGNFGHENSEFNDAAPVAQLERFSPADHPGVEIEWDANISLGRGWQDTVDRVRECREGGTWDDALGKAAGYAPRPSFATKLQGRLSNLQEPAGEPPLPPDLARLLSSEERGHFLHQPAAWEALSALARVLVYARRKIRGQPMLQITKEVESNNRAFSFNPFASLQLVMPLERNAPEESAIDVLSSDAAKSPDVAEPPEDDVVTHRRKELEEAFVFLKSAMELDKWARQTAGELLLSCDWIARDISDNTENGR